jgi:catechol 2,3-dioxygenase-like lactoylglutathione lyase family enzyme
MIKAIHSLIYAHDAQAARAFFRDTLGLPFVDAMDGWLIFELPPAELGIHPAEAEGHGVSGRHTLSLMCDDIHAAVAGLTAKGIQFTAPVKDEGWGITTTLTIPGAGEMMLYQPRHKSPLKPAAARTAARRSAARSKPKAPGKAARPASKAKKSSPPRKAAPRKKSASRRSR